MMKYWMQYFREKKNVLALYFSTVFVFLAVGGLYHIENLPKLTYAAMLTVVPWGAVGVWRGISYVGKRRKLDAAIRHYKQSGELLAEVLWEALGGEQGTSSGELLNLLESVLSAQAAETREWEEKDFECNDYYVMWTHQIKTPIAAMKLLLENGGDWEKNGFFLREELFKIEQYVEMVLTFQRLHSLSSDLVLKEYDLYGMLKNTVRKFSLLFINKGLSLDLQEMQMKVVTDEKWFGFCMGQLISNSVKYTKQGCISIWAKPEEESVTLCVEDTGMGICAEDLPRIFERGFTGYNGRMDEKSSGIGLYLCHRTFAHLGIAVRVESEVDKGTKVFLGIPVRKASGVQAAAGISPGSDVF